MRFAYFAPVAIFIALAVLLGVGLFLGDPKEIPSVFIDEPAPEVSLPPITGYREEAGGLSNELFRQGVPTIVNVWASWCAPCRIEHPILMELAKGDVPIFGLNYKDQPEDARAFLEGLGDPYDRIGADESGRAGIDWGVYGVPETFVIDGNGRIILKHVGPLDPTVVREKIFPALEKAREAVQPAS